MGALRIRAEDRRPQVRERFYNGTDETAADAAIALLSVDGPRGVPGEVLSVTRERYGAVPHSYVLCERDNAVRPALQRRLIREIDAVSVTPTRVFELDSSHSPFLSRPEELTSAIEAVYRSWLPSALPWRQ